MSRILLVFVLFLNGSVLMAQTGADFWKHWGDGQAEVNSYDVMVPRYGKDRKSYDVLIFVTEDFDAKKHVKNDVKQLSSVSVLKLNHARRFQTGIYDYSMMLSSFIPVSNGTDRLETAPLKTSLVVTEWCGNYFEQSNRYGSSLKREYRSYFEKDGDGAVSFSLQKNTIFEDDLLVRVRELQGRFPAGKYPIITSSFYGRLNQFTPGIDSAVVVRKILPVQETLFGRSAVIRYEISIGERVLLVDVLNEGARQILRWERRSGAKSSVEKAVLKKSERLPYWSLQEEKGAKIRSEMSIPAILPES